MPSPQISVKPTPHCQPQHSHKSRGSRTEGQQRSGSPRLPSLGLFVLTRLLCIVRILIMIGQTLQQPWRDIAVQGQMQTWRTSPTASRVEVMDVFARPSPDWYQSFEKRTYRAVSGSRLRQSLGQALMLMAQLTQKNVPHTIEVTDGQLGSGLKLQAATVDDYMFFGRSRVLASLSAALDLDWDVLFMTTASSYVNVGALDRALESAISVSEYGGRLVEYRSPLNPFATPQTFASGCASYVTRSALEAMAPMLTKLSRTVHPDVGIGRLCADLGIRPTPIRSLDVSSTAQLESISEAELAATPHFRLKSGPWDRRQDVPLMNQLHERLLHSGQL